MTTRTTPISPTSTLIVRMLQVCRRLRLLCLDLRTIRSPPSLLVSLRGFSIKTIQNQKVSGDVKAILVDWYRCLHGTRRSRVRIPESVGCHRL